MTYTRFTKHGTMLFLLVIYTMIMVIASSANASEPDCIHGSVLLSGDFEPAPRPAADKQRFSACDNYVYAQMAFLFPENYGLVALDTLEMQYFRSHPAELQLFILTKSSLQLAEGIVLDGDKYGSEYQRLTIRQVKEMASLAVNWAPPMDLFTQARRTQYLRVLSMLISRPVVLDGNKVRGLYFGPNSTKRLLYMQAYCFVRSDIASLTVDDVAHSPLYLDCMDGLGN